MSRRKQSNPKPLKSGDEETWAEDDEKNPKTTTFDDQTTINNKDAVNYEADECSSPTTVLPEKDTSSTIIKVESVDDGNNDRFEVSYASTNSASSPNGCKIETTLEEAIKNEPATSPAPSNTSVATNEHDYVAEPQASQTTLPGTKYYQSTIHTATSDARCSLDTLDIRQGFICPPCGIKFSSLSTLEAHQTYYCMHRQRKKGGTESEGEDGRAQSAAGYDQDESSGGENMNCGEPTTKTAKTGKQYRCSHCSYSADKKVSLNRHMRMHSASPAGSIQNDSDSSAPSVDRYCQECDIRFSNLKTFRAHKQHYCSTRNVINRSAGANPSSSSLPVESRLSSSLPFGSGNPGASQPFIALPTNPVLIVPYSLIQGGSIFSGPISSSLSSTDSVYLLLPDGTIQMVTQAIVNHQNVRMPETSSPVLQPLVTMSNARVRKELISPKCTKAPSISTNNGALDLRTRRGSNGGGNTVAIDVGEEEKENHFMDELADHEDIVCAPSIPLILSPSSSCSTPLPSPLSPESQSSLSRPDKMCSPSPKSILRTTKKLMNGVSSKSSTTVDDKSKNESFTAPSALPAASSFNLSEMLMVTKELQFTPELIPHLTAIQQMSSVAKRPTLNPIANVTLGLLPHVPLASGVVPDLVDPNMLSLLNSELTRRLAVGNVSPNVSQYVRKGTWKCEDCNIGFCKFENYVAHKKHYCSTRKIPESTQSDDSVRTSPLGSPSPSSAIVSPSSQSLPKERVSPVPPLPPPPPPPPPAVSTTIVPNNGLKSAFSQFVCNTCGIKYNSLDNLTTHQTFYCTNRSSTTATVDDETSLRCCTKCKILLPPDQLPTHDCATVSNSLGWKCPCCFVVCDSMNAIQKHFESHTSVKAFLCTICNYKGNTIRGMRTHIRVHFDKRNSDIVEENFISCLMDDSHTLNSAEDRLSENNFEKPSSERVQFAFPSKDPQSSVLSPPTVPVLENSSPPVVIESMDDEEEYIEVEELPLVKSESWKKKTTAAVTSAREENSTSDDVALTAALADQKLSPEVVDDLSVNNNRKNDSKYCKSCDISFKYLPTYLAHKKYYCSSQSSKENTSSLSGGESMPVVIPNNMATAAQI